MKKSSLVLIEDGFVQFCRSGSETVTLPIEKDSSGFAVIGDLIAEELRKYGFRKDRLMLGLSSRQVFFVRTEFDRSTAQNITALKYALEEHLPVDAEQMTPLVIGTLPNQSTIVLENSTVRDLLDHLCNEQDVVFDAIAPVQLLLATHLLKQKIIPNTCRLLIVGSESSDVLSFSSGELVGWKYCHGGPTEHDWELLATSESGELHVLCAEGVNPYRLQFPNTDAELFLEQSTQECLAQTISSIEKNGIESQYDFADRVNTELGLGNAGASMWEMASVALLLCILCVAAAFGFQAYRWNQQATRLDNAVNQEFVDLMPGKRRNGPVMRLLESELSRQRDTNELIAFSNNSAELLANFEAFLLSLPSDIRFRFSSIYVFPDRLDLKGEVKSLLDLDRLKSRFIDNGYDVGAGSTYSKQFNLVLARSTGNSTSNGEAIQP